LNPKTLDIAALGEAMIEFNQTRPGEPHYLQGFGGDTSNAAIAAARSGAKVAYLSRVGNDPWGQHLLDLWHDEGIDVRGVERARTSPTGVYFVTHGQQGHEFSYLRSGSAASRMSPQWLQTTAAKVLVQSARWLHLSGITLAISPGACDAAFEAMQVARDAGTLVSFDANLRLKLWPLERARACIAHAVSLSDLFLPSIDDVVLLSGRSEPHSVVDWAHGLGARRVALKLGSQGCLVSDGQTRTEIAARAVPVMDATGAGDCFGGCLLARLVAGDPLVKAARYASAAAGLAVQGFGAVAPLPRPAAVHAAMA
jgi:2-dehydro-3-deoxygluconokinase